MRNNTPRSDKPNLKGRRAARARSKLQEKTTDRHELNCKRKRRYSREEAEIQAAHVQRRTGYVTEAYVCRFGNHCHIGRVRRKLQDGVVMILRVEKQD